MLYKNPWTKIHILDIYLYTDQDLLHWQGMARFNIMLLDFTEIPKFIFVIHLYIVRLWLIRPAGGSVFHLTSRGFVRVVCKWKPGI